MSAPSNLVLVSLIALSVSFDIDWKSYTPKLPIPLTKACISITTNNTIYIFGGYTENLVPSQKIYSFQPSTNMIHTLNISTPTNTFICNDNAVYSDITHKIYIIGIYTDADWSHTTFNYEFDPLTLEFTPIPNAANKLKQSCIAIYDNYIFVYGGFILEYVSSLFIYDILTKEWIQKVNSTDKIFNGACHAFNDSFYSFGGWNPKLQQTWTGGVVNDILRYDLKMDAWYTINTLTYYKWEMRAVAYNAMDDTVLIIGGYGLTYPSEQYTSFKIEAYNYKENVVISDIGELDESQGGSLMVTSYMNDVVILGGNSYWAPGYTAPDTLYDDIYISYIPTQLSSNISTSNPVSESTETTTVTDTQTKISGSSAFQISKIAVLMGSVILGIICITVCCYVFYKERNKGRLRQEIEKDNANTDTLELPIAKQRTITITPPGMGGKSTTYLSVDNEDYNEGVQSLVGDSVNDDLLNEALNEVLRMPSNMSGMLSDSDAMYEHKAPTLPNDTQQLKNWLTLHELDGYFDNFAVNGYNSILFVKDIKEVNELIDIGIKNQEDQRKLMDLIKLELNNTVIDEGESNIQMHVMITSK